MKPSFCSLELVERVKQVRDEPVRPVLPQDETEEVKDMRLVKMMKQCWMENPDDRPDFYSIKKTILQFNEGK